MILIIYGYFTKIFTFYILFYISYFNVKHDSNNLRLFYKYIYILYPILHIIF